MENIQVKFYLKKLSRIIIKTSRITIKTSRIIIKKTSMIIVNGKPGGDN